MVVFYFEWVIFNNSILKLEISMRIQQRIVFFARAGFSTNFLFSKLKIFKAVTFKITLLYFRSRKRKVFFRADLGQLNNGVMEIPKTQKLCECNFRIKKKNHIRNVRRIFKLTSIIIFLT